MRAKINLYELAEQCLYSPAIEDKLAITDQAAQSLAHRSFAFDFIRPPRPTTDVRFPKHPRQVEPRDLPRRGLNTEAGKIAFLHALAHIEFNAIHLAWDMAYRFRGMPESFYYDWLQVAIEEAAHFRALSGRLRDFGADYGHLPAHRGLWELAEHTASDVLHRLALVPRFMEARGLDVTPGMIAKLEQLGDTASVEILRMILREEIGHVAFGTRWFHYVCERRGLDPEDEYFALVRRYIRGPVRGPFNEEARRRAGFSGEEMERLGRLDGTEPDGGA
jgi:uncharacterized ferritin-like protein (DUF455 family)